MFDLPRWHTQRCGRCQNPRYLVFGRTKGEGTCRASNFPLARLATSLSRASRLEWDFQIAARKASGRMGGAPRGGEGGGSRGEAALAVSHSAARVGGAPLPCARHFLWGTFLV